MSFALLLMLETQHLHAGSAGNIALLTARWLFLSSSHVVGDTMDRNLSGYLNGWVRKVRRRPTSPARHGSLLSNLLPLSPSTHLFPAGITLIKSSFHLHDLRGGGRASGPGGIQDLRGIKGSSEDRCMGHRTALLVKTAVFV